MELKAIYRIEHPDDGDGMWYSSEGILKKTFEIRRKKFLVDFLFPINCFIFNYN